LVLRVAPLAPVTRVNAATSSVAAGAIVRTGGRVGVSGPGGDPGVYPWRFWLEGEPTVSVYRPGKVRPSKPGAGSCAP
jgi:DNA-3-methyladenine glycosylase